MENATKDLVFYVSKTDAYAEEGTLLKLARIRVLFKDDHLFFGFQCLQNPMLISVLV